MYCQNCGTENSNEAKVCVNCGANLENTDFFDENEVEYAGFFRRAIAYIIDGILLGIVNYIVGSLVGYNAVNAAFEKLQGKSIPYGPYVTASVLEVLVALVYFIVLESSKTQGSLGKMIMGLKVVDLNGHRISIITSTFRYLAFAVFGIIGTITNIAEGPNAASNLSGASSIISYISLAYYIIILITMLSSDCNQGLHDKIAKTYVITK